MQNEDASQAGSMGNSAPIARADVDTLPAGSYGPATGNAITGAGTATGSTGADSATAPATIVNVQGAGGPTSQANGNFQANGQYGVLTMDAQGDFNYVRNPGTPDGVKDVFNYTLADASGANSSTTLTIDIGQVQAAAAGQGIVNLPAGVQLSDIHVNGRDLVINMPDGTQMVIPNGAVFVPELAIGDVQVPPTNLAALLIDSEPQPGAGQNQSSGGNFADPVPPLDPGVPLGDLIPPTELTYIPPDFRPIGQFEDTEPTVVIEPRDLAPGAVNALDQVDEKGLPGPRVGDQATETPGTGEIADGNGTNNSDGSETTFGSVVFTAEDGLQSVTIDGIDGNPPITITDASVGTKIVGQFGTLTITDVNLANGTIHYSYTLADNTSGNNTHDDFTVVVTDTDGDTAVATLRIDIVNDTPIAHNDTDAVVKGDSSTDGNVLTGADTTSGTNGADTPGADNLVNGGNGVTGIHAGTSGSFDGVTSGGTLVHGTLGDLVIHSDGSYTYTVTQTNGTPGGNDVFTYQITDGDGDTSTATLTITVPADAIPVANDATALVDDDGLPLGNHDSAPGDDTQNPDPDNDESTVSGTLTANFGGDAPGTFAFAAGMNNSTATVGQETVTYHVVGGVLTAEVTDSPDASREGSDLFTVTINPDGTYSVQLLENVLQINDHTNTENNASATISFTATDGDGDTSLPATLTISLDDDIPTAIIPPPPPEGGPPPPLVTGQVDEDELTTGNHDSAPGDDPGGASTSGGVGSLDALFNAGADQPLTFSLSDVTTGLPNNLTSDGVAVTYEVNGNVLTASAGANTVFTLTVNADGSWTFDLEGQLDHPTLNGQTGDNTENNLFLDLSSVVVATDSDGDSATGAPGAFVIDVDDDMPAQVEGSVQANVDEDELVPNGITDNDSETTVATGSLSGQVHIGADQPGSFSFDEAALSGLPTDLTSGGAAIHFAIVGTTLVGYTGNDPASNQVFTVALDSDGDFTVTLKAQIDHPVDQVSGQPANDDQNLTLDLSGLVQVTDADGDSIHLDARSFLVNFEDDVPIATQTQLSGNVDEDGIVSGPGDNGDGIGIAGGPGDITGEATTASGNVSGLFQSGADVPLTYQLLDSFAGLESQNLSSKGVALTYDVSFDAGTGVYTLTASAGANTVFTFTLNSNTGAYQFTLVDQLDHPTLNGLTGDDTENDLPIQLGSIIQATDHDGDTVTANSGENSGLVIHVNDDTPVANNDQDAITNGGTTASGNVISGSGTLFPSDGQDHTGADAPISVIKIEGTGGSDDHFDNNVLHVVGSHGFIDIQANGDYTYTRTDNVGGVDDTFTYTIEDADGDKTTATLTIHIEDKVPLLATPDDAHLDDDAVSGAGGNPGGTGDDGPPNPGDADVATGTLVGSGGDGTLTYHFAANVDQTGLPTGFTIDTANSTATHLVIEQNGTDVITVDLNAGTGAYTVTQIAPITHPTQDGTVNDNTENNIDNIGVKFFVTDQDGDPSNTVTLTINVDDDTPAQTAATVVAHVDEDELPGGITDNDSELTTQSGSISALASIGADKPGAFSFDPNSLGGLPALTSQGATVHYDVVNGDLVAYTGSDSSLNHVFTVSLTSGGAYTVTLDAPIDHIPNTPANDDNQDKIIDISGAVQVTDADGDSIHLDGGSFTIAVEDDIPDAQTSGSGVGTVTLDETRAEGTDTAGGTLPAGDSSATIDLSAGFVTGGSVKFGADGAAASGSVSYALHLSANGIGSGMFALDNSVANGKGSEITLSINGAGTVITGSVGLTTYFTITIDPSTGIATFHQVNNIWNPVAGSSAAALDDVANLHTAAASDITVIQTVKDFDGDTDTASVNIGQDVFQIQDDGPRFGTVDTTLQIDNTGTHPSGTGDMQIIIGTDSPNGPLSGANPAQTQNDLSVSNFTIDVNGSPAQNVVLTPGTESATTASYSFAFDYDTGNGTTDHETGTLVFDKSAGTYTVTLDHPVVGFSTLQTAQGTAFTGYVFNTSTTTNSQPDVAVTTIKGESSPGAHDGFFVQFTGFTAGNGSHETIGDGTATGYVNGDLFSEGTSVHNSWVSATGSSNGVAGDTVNGPDGLNFNLYSSDPQGFFSGQTGNPSTASASDMFLVFDGIGSQEDMIVILKLGADTNNDGVLDSFTTKAIVVQNSDIFKFDAAHEAGTVAALTGSKYQDVLDSEVALGGSNNNDGLVIIESNDYNAAGQNYVIIGAQIVNADAGVSGTGINLVGAINSGSSASEDLADISNTNPLKITNIGFITGATEQQNATISFDTTIHDVDGDTATTSVTVNIGDTSQNTAATLSTLATQSTEVASQTPLNTSSLFASNDNVHDHRAFNVGNTAALMGAVAAAGLSSMNVTTSNTLISHDSGHEAMIVSTAPTTNVMSIDNEEAGIFLDHHFQQASVVPGSGQVAQGGGTIHDMVETSHALTASSVGDAHVNTELLQGTTVPGHAAGAGGTAVTAAAVAMPSAEQLAAVIGHVGGSANPQVSVAGAQHNEVVGKVLADALHGGEAHGGTTVDMLVNAMSSHGGAGGNAALEALASHASGDVSYMHTIYAAAIGTPQTMLNLEMAMHQDAPPPAHG